MVATKKLSVLISPCLFFAAQFVSAGESASIDSKSAETPNIKQTVDANVSVDADKIKAAKKLRAEETIKAIKDAEARGVKPTKANIEANVLKAAECVAKEGEAHFAKFSGKDSEYINSNACYIYVVDMQGNMLFHPVLFEMDGTNVMRLRDMNGRPIIAPVTQLDNGWYEYFWPRPGSTKPERKATFVKRTTMPNGKVIALASGAYDI